MTVTETLNEAEYVRLYVQSALSCGERFLDPDPLVRDIREERISAGSPADETQTRDYVLHCLREAPHVCRHQEYGYYRIHPEPHCGPDCEPHAKHQPVRSGPVCMTCFLPTTPTGACGCG